MSAKRPRLSPRRPRRGPRLPLDVFLPRQRRYRWLRALLALVLLALLLYADRRGWLLHETDDWRHYHEQWFTVARVVDGDTLMLDTPDGEHRQTRVRLWGIDTPELAKPREQRPAEPGAEAARDFLDQLATGRRVRLTLQSQRIRDSFGRVLAYVTLEDGQVLNEQLLLAGLAHNDPRWTHDQLARYAVLEEQAKADRRGLWQRKPAEK